MPIEASRRQRILTEDEQALIAFWIKHYERPVLRGVLFITALITGVLMAATLLLSSVPDFFIVTFWLTVGALLFTWSYVSVCREHETQLRILKAVDLDNDVFVVDIAEDDLTPEDMEHYLGKPRLFEPERCDQLIVSRGDGQLQSIEFVSEEGRVYLMPKTESRGR